MLKRLLHKFRILTYNVGFIEDDIQSVIENGFEGKNIKWLKHKYKDRFFADPFLWNYDDNYFYVLVEEYLFNEKKGKISLLKIDRNTYTLTNRRVVIEEDFHLSFPFCELDSEYVLVESIGSGKTFQYKLDKKNLNIIQRNVLVDAPLIDPIKFTSLEGDEYIFAGHTSNPSGEIYLYKKEMNGEYRLIKYIPWKCGKSNSRSAGKIFVYNGSLVRPTQDCVKRYGHQIQLMSINSFDFISIPEIHLRTLNSASSKKFNETMHTFNVYDEIIIVDGSKDKLKFFRKIYIKLIEKIKTYRKKIKQEDKK
ncbi:MAG: hypothetical protein RBQ97_02830 [Acholeplasma sp.]|nr:hypothetical protein [Acholeplasma sp.]